MSIKLGDRVKDSITGFKGIATARAEYLYGCVQVLVQPESIKDGAIVKSQWMDEQRLDVKSEAEEGGLQNSPRGIDHPPS